MAARKEAMMSAVRQELAVQNAQELMNVSTTLYLHCVAAQCCAVYLLR